MSGGIDFSNVTFGYVVNGEYLPIFDDLRFHAEPGTITAILGPSGGGKTTLLNLAAGLIRPTGGTIRVLGKDPANELGRLPLAYSFVSTPLLPHLTVLQNAALPLKLRGVAEANDRASAALKEVGLSSAESWRPHQLSAGMRVRVGIAAGIAMDPEVYLLDEPHAALDLITRRNVSRVIREGVQALRARRPVTVLLATHAESEAIELADRCVVLNHQRPAKLIGEVAVPRRPTTLIEKPLQNGIVSALDQLLEEASKREAVVIFGDARKVSLPPEVRGVPIVLQDDNTTVESVVPTAVIAIGSPPSLSEAEQARTNGKRYLVGGPTTDHAGWTEVASIDAALTDLKSTSMHAGHPQKPIVAWREGLLAWLGLLAAVVSVWVFATSIVGVEPYLVPTPVAVAKYFGVHGPSLLRDMLQTGIEAAIGVLAAAVIAGVAGALSDRFVWVDRALWPVFVSSQVIPLLAIAPAIHIWLPGLTGIVAMTTLICFFPVAVAFRAGLRQPTADELALFELHTRRWWSVFRTLRLPRSMRTTMAGLRAAAPLAVIGSILAGLAGAESGLGRNFLLASRKVNTELLFASLILATALGLLFYGIACAVERLVVPSYMRTDTRHTGGTP